MDLPGGFGSPVQEPRIVNSPNNYTRNFPGAQNFSGGFKKLQNLSRTF